jgi:hypothetical protein
MLCEAVMVGGYTYNDIPPKPTWELEHFPSGPAASTSSSSSLRNSSPAPGTSTSAFSTQAQQPRPAQDRTSSPGDFDFSDGGDALLDSDSSEDDAGGMYIKNERLFVKSSRPHRWYSLLFIIQITRNRFQRAETNKNFKKNRVQYSWKRLELRDTAGLCLKTYYLRSECNE